MKRVRQTVRRLSRKKLIAGAVIALLLLMVAVQVVYPSSHTMLGARVDGVAIGGMAREDAVRHVQEIFSQQTVAIYFGEAAEPYRSPELAVLGAAANEEAMVERAMYPWWLRLVPTSLWWGHRTIAGDPEVAVLNGQAVREYAGKELGKSCEVEPKNASITVKDDRLVVVPSEDGGHCDLDEVVARVQAVKPTAIGGETVRIPVERIAPAVTDTEAERLVRSIEQRLDDGVVVRIGDTKVPLESSTVRSWLVFSTDDDTLAMTIDTDKAKGVLEKEVGPAATKKPGIMTIKTRDFVEISRSGGSDGRTLNIAGTTKAIVDYLQHTSDEVAVVTSVVPAERNYERSYSSTDIGLSALMKHYADSHPGTYGVSLIELSGDRRRAHYNGDRKFTTASTYKVYVAYSAIKQVERGKLKWGQQIQGGRTLGACFYDMIALSDNPCPEQLVRRNDRIGYNTVHADIQALGLTNTSFIDQESFKTTANDLSTFMASLETGQLPITKADRNRFMTALKGNVYRQGISAGASGSVANKVGFLDGLLHDTAIVTGSGGTYVLTILTDKSSWGNIADLTREIEKLRKQ